MPPPRGGTFPFSLAESRLLPNRFALASKKWKNTRFFCPSVKIIAPRMPEGGCHLRSLGSFGAKFFECSGWKRWRLFPAFLFNIADLQKSSNWGKNPKMENRISKGQSAPIHRAQHPAVSWRFPFRFSLFGLKSPWILGTVRGCLFHVVSFFAC